MSPTQHFFLSSRCVKIETKTAACTNFQGVWPTTLFDNMQFTQSSCALRNSSSLLLRSHFCGDFHAIRRHKKRCISDYFLPASPHVPFKYCFSCQTELNPWVEFRKKWASALKETHRSKTTYIWLRLNYKATFKCKIICTKIDNKSFNLTQFRPFKVPTVSVLASGRPSLVHTK